MSSILKLKTLRNKYHLNFHQRDILTPGKLTPMYCNRVAVTTRSRQCAQLLGSLNYKTTTRPVFIGLQHQWGAPPGRNFSTSRPALIKEFFPAPDAPQIRTTEAAWKHPVYTQQQMDAVVVAHRNAKTWSDKVALGMVRLLRWGLDLVTGYKHDPDWVQGAKDPNTRKPQTVMKEGNWMIR